MTNQDNQIVELDVRDILRKNEEPFHLIMDTVDKLGQDDVFVLHTTFKPLPLFSVMERKGFDYQAEQKNSDHWIITFTRKE